MKLNDSNMFATLQVLNMEFAVAVNANVKTNTMVMCAIRRTAHTSRKRRNARKMRIL